MSVLAQAMSPTAALKAQRRSSLLVARVPVVPLFALIVANLLLSIAGFVLLIVALSHSSETAREAQARLSIAGLVAHAFE